MITDESRVMSVPSENLVMGRLTDRELEVLTHVAAGSRNREIATELNVSVKTVEFHLSNILGKLGVRSRTEAVVRAWKLGVLGLTAFPIGAVHH